MTRHAAPQRRIPVTTCCIAAVLLAAGHSASAQAASKSAGVLAYEVAGASSGSKGSSGGDPTEFSGEHHQHHRSASEPAPPRSHEREHSSAERPGVVAASAPPPAASDRQKKDIGSFFREMDADDDGQIETHELSVYLGQSVGGQDLDTEHEIRDAVADVTQAMDSHDVGSSISEEELISHLTKHTNQLLTTHRVERWVRYGLGYPQYAERFATNAITALDFPALIADDGQALREDLGITSSLHQGKLTRALKRQILGLGSLPTEPTEVHAGAINATAIAVQWSPPDDVGAPPVHAYVVQVREGGSPTWETVGHVAADEMSYVARVQPRAQRVGARAGGATSSNSGDGKGKGKGGGKGRGGGKETTTVPYQYRVVAWGAHGCSGYSGESPAVEMRPVRKSTNGGGVGTKAQNQRADDDDEGDDGNEGGDEDDGGSVYSMFASTFLLAGLAARFLFSSASFIGGPGTVRAVMWNGITLAFNRWRGGGEAAGSGSGHRLGPASEVAGDEGGGANGASRWRGSIDGARTGASFGSGSEEWDGASAGVADDAAWAKTPGAASPSLGEGGGASARRSTAGLGIDIGDADGNSAGMVGAGAAMEGVGSSPLQMGGAGGGVGGRMSVTLAPSSLRREGSRETMEVGGIGGVGGGIDPSAGGRRPPLHRTPSKSWVINNAMAAAMAAGVAGDCPPPDDRSPIREQLSQRGSYDSLTSNGSGSYLDERGGGCNGGGGRGGEGPTDRNQLGDSPGGGAGSFEDVGGGGVSYGVRMDGCAGAKAAAEGAVIGSESKKKGRCCAVGCEARWDRWMSMGDIRMKYTKHYCGLCQRGYCQAHTRVSPHGATGRCDPESKCYCATCHATLDRATQEALEMTNKLPALKAAEAGGEAITPSKKAKTLWRSIKNYKLRTASSALGSESPCGSTGNLAGLG